MHVKCIFRPEVGNTSILRDPGREAVLSQAYVDLLPSTAKIGCARWQDRRLMAVDAIPDFEVQRGNLSCLQVPTSVRAAVANPLRKAHLRPSAEAIEASTAACAAMCALRPDTEDALRVALSLGLEPCVSNAA